jgi:hypothetical protein
MDVLPMASALSRSRGAVVFAREYSGAKGLGVLHHLLIFRHFFHFHKNLSSSVISGNLP